MRMDKYCRQRPSLREMTEGDYIAWQRKLKAILELEGMDTEGITITTSTKNPEGTIIKIEVEPRVGDNLDVIWVDGRFVMIKGSPRREDDI